MRLTLVGNRTGRRVILWSGVLKLAAVVVPIPGLIAVLVMLLVTKFWNTQALLLGFAAGGVIVILVVIAALCTELRKLPMLHDDKRPSP